MKKDEMWAIWEPSIGFYCGTWLTRRDAIADFISECRESWNKYKAAGHKVIRVKLVPIEKRLVK